MKKVIVIMCAITTVFCAFIITILLLQPTSHKTTNISELKQGATTHINKDGQLNLNAATKDELMLLEGIGEVLAQKIIDHRVANGKFENISDLLKISGIGPSTLEQIANYIYVE